MWSAGFAIRKLNDVLQWTRFVRTLQKANFPIIMAGVIQVDEGVDVTRVFMFVEGPILMHWEGMAGLGRFNVHCAMMQLYSWPNQLGNHRDQFGLQDGLEPVA